jgi:hypothetical protein
MPDSIYLRAETCLITDRDIDLIKGICTSAVAPTHTGPRLPGKNVHASGKTPWTTDHDGARQGLLGHPSPHPRAPGK